MFPRHRLRCVTYSKRRCDTIPTFNPFHHFPFVLVVRRNTFNEAEVLGLRTRRDVCAVLDLLPSFGFCTRGPAGSPTQIGKESSYTQPCSTSCALICSVLNHAASSASILTRWSKKALSTVTSRLPVLPTMSDDCVLYSGFCGALLWVQDCFTTLPSGIGSNTSTITMGFRSGSTHSIAPSFVPSFLLNLLSRDSDEMDVDFDQSQLWAAEEDSDIVSYSNTITDSPNVSSASSHSSSSGTHSTVPKESSFVSSDYVSSSTSSIRDSVFVHKEKLCGRRVFAIPFSLVEDVEEEEEERQEEDEIAKMLCDSLWRSRHLQ
ncbi:hypothetical protein K474DRAFT_976923 [Panus rudis PR-1116 ss-1]|nr:hypothetical protein K474DRAFT_976923 [Panus rudis PR-1116 ss-1]